MSAAADDEVRDAIVLTVFAASAATAIALVLGVPLGYLLARYRFPGSGLLRGILDLPVVVPHPVAGIALLLFWDVTAIGGALGRAGLEIVSHIPGSVAAMLSSRHPARERRPRGIRHGGPQARAVARNWAIPDGPHSAG